MNLQAEIEHLFAIQQERWEQLSISVRQQDAIEQKSISWGEGFTVKVQYNPARMRSATAKVSREQRERRPCFLCQVNRPRQQQALPFLEKYAILCNPFPILSNHITIPLHSHVPQRIRRKMGDMLTLAEELPDYVIFYNGPKCGASAPDHFHLQAGLKRAPLLQGDNALRSCLMIESGSRREVEELFELLYQYLHQRQPEEEEPMMNLILFTEENRYRLHLFPRKAHRPWQYYDEGARQLMISPGALDMAGLIITVREEDYQKITAEDIEDIYAQVSLPVI